LTTLSIGPEDSAKCYTYDRLDNIAAITAVPASYGNDLAIVPETPLDSIVHRNATLSAGSSPG
jgi:hypothetical protein